MEMEKRQIFGKTVRIGDGTFEWLLTEKLDGSNLCFFKWDGSVYVALRKNIINLDDLADDPAYFEAEKLYKGLEEWIEEHYEDLDRQLLPGAAICGEWLGMGQIKYPKDVFTKQYYMFAKARVDETAPLRDVELTRFNYDPEDFHYVFRDDAIPDYIGVVPVVGRLRDTPTADVLDGIYDTYAANANRPVEGIVVTQKEVPDRRCKYVRRKGGKLTAHITAEEMKARKAAGIARKQRHEHQTNS